MPASLSVLNIRIPTAHADTTNHGQLQSYNKPLEYFSDYLGYQQCVLSCDILFPLSNEGLNILKIWQICILFYNLTGLNYLAFFLWPTVCGILFGVHCDHTEDLQYNCIHTEIKITLPFTSNARKVLITLDYICGYQSIENWTQMDASQILAMTWQNIWILQ